MAARDAVTLNETDSRLEVPQAGDTYNLPRDTNVAGALTTEQVVFPDGSSMHTAAGTIAGALTDITNISALRNLTISNGEAIYLISHTTSGDGGGGHFRGVTGAAPGTYVDNNGTIIVPTGGDGSEAWLREYSSAINVDWFGASKTLPITDCTMACQAAIDYAQSIMASVEFSQKQYSISRQGGVIGYDGVNQNYYALLVTAGITVNLNGAELLINESDATYATAILCHNTTNVIVKNGKVTNTNILITDVTAKHLFTGCAVGLLNCISSHVRDIVCNSTRGGVQMYRCTSSSISNCESDISTVINSKLGTHFGCYGGTDNEIANCTSHVSCGDGDIFLYGSGSCNRLINNHAYNYVKGDATKTLVFNIGQGMGADSGQHEATISGNYVYGHYYGIDVKNDSDGTKVIGNTASYCKAGLSCRLGETPGRNYRVLFDGNVVNIGTGMGALNTYLIDGIYEAVGFFGEKASGLTVSNTTIGIQHSSSTTMNAGGIYISDSWPRTLDQQQGLQLVDNNISAQTNAVGINCRFTGALVTVTNKASTTRIEDVTVSGQFDPIYGTGALKDACSFTGVKGLSFSANLSRTYSTYAISLDNCSTVNISSNFSWHRGLLTALNSNAITMSGCALGGNNSTNQGGYRETVHLDTCTFVNIHGNTGIDGATGGKFVNAIASDWISVQGNVIDMPQFSAATFVTFDATGVNTTVANNLIK